MQYFNLSILLFVSIMSNAQPKPKIKDWHYLDFEKDGYHGISLQQAYELLKGKKSSTVLVAVIDSGIDTAHNDINFWNNPNEIPNNGIDDNNNGLVDDYFGWNYLGAPKGENLAISVTDYYRTYHRFKNEFENKTKNEIDSNALYTYSEWQRAKTYITEQYDNAIKMLEPAKTDFAYAKKINEKTKLLVGKDVFTKEDIEIPTKTDEEQECITVWKRVFGNRNFTNADYIKDYEKYIAAMEEAKKQMLENPIDYRGQLLKDESYNIDKKHYGNTNLKQHSGNHGTSVSSIIGAIRNNNIGINGIANNVQIMMVRAILGKDEYDKDVALAIRYAVDNGAKVINMSFGKYISPDKKWVDEAIQYALQKNVVVVHASGNDGENIDVNYNYPNAFTIDNKKLPNFINVGASGDYSTGALVPFFTNYGKKTVDVFAPGVDIHCAVTNGGTQLASGTSMASPVVAGVAALLMSYFPKLSATQVVEIINKSAVIINEDVVLPGTSNEKIKFKHLSHTGGIVNAAKAVQLALAYK
jgi:subtilisin family serine protease